MSETTNIEWCDSTFNPWWGCTKISPACDNCYAAALDKRTGGNHWGAGVERRRTSPANWAQPIRWNKNHEEFFKEHGRRQRVFCASMADVFDNEVDPQWRADLFELIAKTPNLDWLLLTKRIGNANQMIFEALERSETPALDFSMPNVWIGATICNQAEADRDIPKLLAVPAAKRFLSIEPLLEGIDLEAACEIAEHSLSVAENGELLSWSQMKEPLLVAKGLRAGSVAMLDWVIVGGESGHGARPMHPDWVRSLRDQCEEANVPFFFKQSGDFIPTDETPSHLAHFNDVKSRGRDPHNGRVGIIDGMLFTKVGKKAAGRLLDGVEHNEVPA